MFILKTHSEMFLYSLHHFEHVSGFWLCHLRQGSGADLENAICYNISVYSELQWANSASHCCLTMWSVSTYLIATAQSV